MRDRWGREGVRGLRSGGTHLQVRPSSARSRSLPDPTGTRGEVGEVPDETPLGSAGGPDVRCKGASRGAPHGLSWRGARIRWSARDGGTPRERRPGGTRRARGLGAGGTHLQVRPSSARSRSLPDPTGTRGEARVVPGETRPGFAEGLGARVYGRLASAHTACLEVASHPQPGTREDGGETRCGSVGGPGARV
jgi:hypothetical protein